MKGLSAVTILCYLFSISFQRSLKTGVWRQVSQSWLPPSLWGLSHTCPSSRSTECCYKPCSVLTLQRCLLPHARFSKQKQRFTAPHGFQLCNCCTTDVEIKPCWEMCFASIKLLSSLYVSWLPSSPTPVLFHPLIYIQYDICSLFMLIVLIFLTYLQTFNFQLLHNLLLSSFVFSFFLFSIFFTPSHYSELFLLLCILFSSTPYLLQAGKRCFFLSHFFGSFVCLHRLKKQDC